MSGVPVPKYEPHAVNDLVAGSPVVYPVVPNVVKFHVGTHSNNPKVEYRSLKNEDRCKEY